QVVVLAAVLGMVNTFDMPARQAFIIELVGREDLMNAIALNSSIFNAARALGPAVAGIVIASFSTGVAFFLNGLSFLAVIAGLFMMRIEEQPRTGAVALDVLADTREALAYVRKTPLILTTIVLVGIVSVFAANFNVLVPVFARIELNRNAAAFGFLMSSFGAGALVGAVTLTLLSRSGPRPSILYGSGLGLSLVLILIGLQKSYGFTAFLLALCGWCIVTFFGTANTTVQLNSEDRLRGRVMSVYTMAFGGLSPFGSLFAGSVAQWLHTPFTFALGGLITGLAFLSFLTRRSRLSLPKNAL
ncbi:MAG: MFS transporter, partial [Nitrospiraceae bacterium]|nr:MFS transporter [Nitrospiraceae bacterium]